MSISTHVLFYAGYALAALTVGLALDQLGGSGAYALVGSIAFFAACASAHAGVAVWHTAGLIIRSDGSLTAEITRLRCIQREIVSEIDSLVARMLELDSQVKPVSQAAAGAAPPAPEILIGDIVDRLSGDAVHSPETLGLSADIVRAALIGNRIELHVQPILSLPQRRTAFYEAFTRLKDETGRLLLPHEFLPAAEQAGLMWQIDNLLLFRCAQLIRRPTKSGRKPIIFCNISLSALIDERFFAPLLAFARDNRDLADALVFEIPQSAFERRTGAEARAMAQLAELGFSFSIDKVSRIDLDLPDLERAHVRYLKIPERVLVEQVIQGGMRPRSNLKRNIEATDVADVCARYGVDIIAERIETDEAARQVLQLGISYAQGHLFGAPAPVHEGFIKEGPRAPAPQTRERRAVA